MLGTVDIVVGSGWFASEGWQGTARVGDGSV